VILLLLLSVVPARGQMIGGLSVGATWSDLDGDLIEEADWRRSFLAGVSLDYYFLGGLSFGFEANYLQMGAANITTTNLSGIDFKLQYFELPLLFRFRLRFAGSWLARLHAGVSPQVKLGCNVVGESGSSVDCGTSPPAGDVRNSAWAVPLGGGVGYDFGTLRGVAEARYSLGLTDVFEQGSAKNRSWQLLLRLETEL
jgi:hypothetical protein